MRPTSTEPAQTPKQCRESAILIVADRLFAEVTSLALSARGLPALAATATTHGGLRRQMCGHNISLVVLRLEPLDPVRSDEVRMALDVAQELDIPTVGLSTKGDGALAGELLNAGMSDLAPAALTFPALVDILTAVQAGIRVLDSKEHRHLQTVAARHQEQRRADEQQLKSLTPRELMVLAKLMKGRSVAEIATDDFVQVSTVRSQVSSVLRKLDVSTQLSAVALAHRLGLSPEAVRGVQASPGCQGLQRIERPHLRATASISAAE
ncbi:MAG: two-component system nitrate/nitrite response regulator NarL [Candidatus Poriferisodalaceae bacterium]|jgi:two-component system nitrate/nitrite response regulator NarL